MKTTTVASNSLVLLEKLLHRQQAEHLSDYKFAYKLGITRPLWQLTRTGRRHIGLNLLKAIVSTYPELIPDVISFLRDSHESG